jgi:flavin reductase (DIM6/NTAB) family NADH-FMN oxidoreductase RutF
MLIYLPPKFTYFQLEYKLFWYNIIEKPKIKHGGFYMYKEIKYNELSKELLGQLQRGAFLTAKSGDRVNTMTIAWGSIGYMWNKPVFIAMVRYSRYTYEIIDNAQDFTVGFPLNGQLKEALSICGTKSGRDIDKFRECNLKLIPGHKVDTPLIDECDIQLECKIVYKQPMDGENLAEDLKKRSYPEGDYHVLYYGEIVGAYIRE